MEFLKQNLSTGSDPTFPIELRLLPSTTNFHSQPCSTLAFRKALSWDLFYSFCTRTTLIRRHSISNQSFADDTQLHDSCRPDQIDTSVQGMQDCISDVKTWITSNKLKLNDDKTECLLIVSKEPLSQTLTQNPFT